MEKVTNVSAKLEKGTFNIYFTFRKKIWNVTFNWQEMELKHYDDIWDYWTGDDGLTFEITGKKDDNGFPMAEGVYVIIYDNGSDEPTASSLVKEDDEDDDRAQIRYGSLRIAEWYSEYLYRYVFPENDATMDFYVELAKEWMKSRYYNDDTLGTDESIQYFMQDRYPDVYEDYDYNDDISYIVMSISEMCGEYFCEEYNDAVQRHRAYVRMAKAIFDMSKEEKYMDYTLDEVLEVYMKYHYPQAFTMKHVEK